MALSRRIFQQVLSFPRDLLNTDMRTDEDIDCSVIDSPIQTKTRESKPPNEEPTKLSNGKWECNHKCKDKTAYVTFHYIRARLKTQLQTPLLPRRTRQTTQGEQEALCWQWKPVKDICQRHQERIHGWEFWACEESGRRLFAAIAISPKLFRHRSRTTARSAQHEYFDSNATSETSAVCNAYV